ncbi:7503_t:CDS:2, partial [Dentiscutata heterogama]
MFALQSWKPKNKQDKAESGVFNAIIDMFNESVSVETLFEYIPRKRLKNSKILASGSFSTIYTAEWLDGEIENVDFVKNSIKRKGPQHVALKTLPIDEKKTNELFRSYYANLCGFDAKIFGVSSFFESSFTCFMVMKLYEVDARSLIARDYWSLLWVSRFSFIFQISKELTIMHDKGFIHGDLHSGNILCDELGPTIADLGFSYSLLTNDKIKGPIY